MLSSTFIPHKVILHFTVLVVPYFNSDVNLYDSKNMPQVPQLDVIRKCIV